MSIVGLYGNIWEYEWSYTFTHVPIIQNGTCSFKIGHHHLYMANKGIRICNRNIYHQRFYEPGWWFISTLTKMDPTRQFWDLHP